MKIMRAFLFVILIGTMFSGCGPATKPTVTPFPKSMKGYELYSWQEGGQWKFSILIGTNREKTLEEIQSTNVVLSSVDELKSALENIPTGQYITWSLRETLSFPPDEILKQIEQTCNDEGLILNIVE